MLYVSDGEKTVVAVLALIALWLVINVSGVLLVGWLGVLFVNAVLATTYPVYTGWVAVALIRLITMIFR